MAGFIIEYTDSKNGYTEIEEGYVKYWQGEGLITYEGSLTDFAQYKPEVISEMILKKIIKIIA
jgi:hypothetical protein